MKFLLCLFMLLNSLASHAQTIREQNLAFIKTYENVYLSTYFNGHRGTEAYLLLSANGKYMDLGFGDRVIRLECNVFLTSCSKVTQESSRSDNTQTLSINSRTGEVKFTNATQVHSNCGPCYAENVWIILKD